MRPLGRKVAWYWYLYLYFTVVEPILTASCRGGSSNRAIPGSNCTFVGLCDTVDKFFFFDFHDRFGTVFYGLSYPRLPL
jgi:hypothetical protein